MGLPAPKREQISLGAVVRTVAKLETRLAVEVGGVADVTLYADPDQLSQALINLVQAQSNRYADTAALFQSLGGGWWNRADIPKS